MLQLSLRRLATASPAVAPAAAVTPAAPTPATSDFVTVQVKDHVMIIRMDAPGSKVNTLGEAMSRELEAAFKRAETEPGIAGAVLISGKADSWIAGADIGMLARAGSPEALAEISRNAQGLFDRVAGSSRPIVAAINGNCLGGGLETALACHYRIATASPKTTLAVPEVMLGLLPGAGGTQRLPRTVGLQEGLTMCMTGKNVAAEKAKKIGLVDMVVDPYALENAAIRAVKDIAAGRVSRSKPKQKPLFTRLLEDTEVGQNLVFDQAKKTVMKQTGGHYPAPLAILECVRAGVQKGAKAGFAKESEEFGKLGGTAVSSSLISIFNGQTACKKNNFGKPEAPIRTVACVGAGLMGSGIAAVTVQKGYTTILKDVTEAAVARGEANVYSIMDKKVKKKQLSAFNRDATLSQLVPLTDKDQHWKAHFAKADMVIEAVFESLELKHKVMAELEAVIPAHCVFATNTSALPITQIAKASKRPDKVVGMHYFSPVEKMPLLEVVTHEGTSRSTVAAAVDVGLKQGKTVIVVKDGPGFYTTRILSPFMSEGAALLNEGVSISRLDAALKKFGFPVGPVTLLDEVGIDVGYHISKDLIKALGDRMGGADPAVFGDMVKAGLLGRKSGKGFFLYDQAKPSAAGKAISAVQGALASLGVPGVKKPSSGKPINPEAEAILARYSRAPRDKEGKLLPSAVTDADICNRLVLRMVNEAVLCLQEGVLANPVDGDIGAVFGLGFPPFLGGPFRYIDAVGSAAIVKAMEDLGERLGDKVRFAPAPLLLQHAKNNTKFHSAK